MDGDPRAAGRVATAVGVLFGLAGTGTSAVAVALPELAAGLGVGASSAAWVISGYAVALAVLTAVHGRIADIVGVRGPLVIGVVLMAAGALVAATAPTFRCWSPAGSCKASALRRFRSSAWPSSAPAGTAPPRRAPSDA